MNELIIVNGVAYPSHIPVEVEGVERMAEVFVRDGRVWAKVDVGDGEVAVFGGEPVHPGAPSAAMNDEQIDAAVVEAAVGRVRDVMRSWEGDGEPLDCDDDIYAYDLGVLTRAALASARLVGEVAQLREAGEQMRRTGIPPFGASRHAEWTAACAAWDTARRRVLGEGEA